MLRAFVTAALCLGAETVLAEPVSKASALEQLFDEKKIVVQVAGHLSDVDKATIRALVPLMAQQMRVPARYYGSIAYAEAEGLASESLQGAFNFHSVVSADAAALTACRASAKSSPRSCRLAARVLPRGYQERGLTLSQGATAAIRKELRGGTRPQVFARSTSTGAWAIGAGDAEAISACNKGASGRADCEVVIRE